jgi:hypothetical protein
VAECSSQLHQSAAAGQELVALEAELDRHAARLFGVTDEQLSEISESYRELTKADIAAQADDEGEDEDGTINEIG